MFYERRLHATHELPPHCCPVCCCCPCHASFAPPTAATPICRLCCSWSIPFQHAPQHSAPAAVACRCCLPQQLVACDFLRILTLHCQCNWQALATAAATGDGNGDGDGDDGDDSATRRCHRLQQLLKCSYNFYADSQRAICSLSLPCSVSLPLSLSLFRIISQFSQFYCYYHEESDYYYYYYYYYAGFKNTHFGMCMHMHGI